LTRALALLFAAPLVVAAAPPQVSSVKAVRPEPRERAHALRVSANLTVEQDIAVTTRVTGVVDNILAERGAEVKKGQPLATLDQREFELDRRAAEETLSLSQLEYKRYQELFKQNLTSQAELDQRKSRYELARVEFEKAKLVIDRSVIRAPFDGVVVDRFVRLGQKVLLDESAPLFKVMALEPLMARVYLPEQVLATAKAGMDVEVEATEIPGVKTTGKVAFLSPVVDPASGTVQAVVKVARDAKRALRPGMSVQVAIPGVAGKTLALPASVLLEKNVGRRGRARVFEIADGKLQERVIDFEKSDDGTIEVRSGLTDSSWVVREPSPSLKSGQAVVIAP
jgi:membrane fusion protein (multidrug efflux system)